MTEREKCDAGMLYDVSSPEREEQHLFCMELCYDYNHTRPSEKAEREKLLRRLFGRLGKNPYVEPDLFCGFGYNIEAGNNLFVNNNCVFVDTAKIIFGDGVMIGPQCGFYTALHPIDSAMRAAGLEAAYPINIGSNVWLGGGVLVLPGVTIGDNAVIGAGSVVTQSIPPAVLAFGNPCRVQRPITEDDRLRYSSPEYSAVPNGWIAPTGL